MIDIEKILRPDLSTLDPHYAMAVVRHRGSIHWLFADQNYLVLDWNKWRGDFIAAGHQVPDLNTVAAAERSGLVVVDQNTAEKFLGLPEVHKLDLQLLRQTLLERFPSAQSWWDVEFLFPMVFIDFDNRRLAGFYPPGSSPRFERYIPDGWVGEFVDFANTYSEEVFPSADKFWIVDGKDLLHELNERGRALEENREQHGAHD